MRKCYQRMPPSSNTGDRARREIMGVITTLGRLVVG